MVGGGDEQHFGEIVRDLQIVIGKFLVLFRIEYLQQSRGRVAPESDTQLIDLVEDEDRVERPCPLHRLDDPSRQRTDIRTAVTAHFGLIAHAAKGNTHELPAKGFSDRFSQGGLSRPRRPDETQDRLPISVRLKAADGNRFQDAVLGFFQPVMILFQHFYSVCDIQVVFRDIRPWQVENPVDIRADHAHFRRHWRHLVQPLELFQRSLFGFLGQFGILDLGMQILEFLAPWILLPQFTLDDAHLLTEVILPLAALDLILHLGMQLIFQLQHPQLAD